MRRYTRAPWFASEPLEDEWGMTVVTIGPHESADGHYEETIAEVLGINHDAVGNARIIIVAPEAVELLEEWLEYFEEEWTRDGGHPMSRMAPFVRDGSELLEKAGIGAAERHAPSRHIGP